MGTEMNTTPFASRQETNRRNSLRSNDRRQRTRQRRQRILLVESLEIRRVLAAPAAVDDGYVASEDVVLSVPGPIEYDSVVLADNPLAYWRLGEAAGPSVRDHTGNEHTGSADAGVTFGQPNVVPNLTDTAARTVGTDRITVPGFEKFGVGATGFTTEYWLTINSPIGTHYNIVGDGESGGDFYFMNYLTNTGKIRPHFSFANTVSMDSAATLQSGQTYHVATTWDAVTGQGSIYIDGALDSTAAIGVNPPSNSNNAVFIGKGMSDLRPQAEKLGVADHITLIEELAFGPNDHDFKIPSSPLVELYKSADACAFPSLIETFAMINIEAMAAGIPVISTDAPGCIETINDGVDGLIAIAGDPIDLARKMELLQSSADLRTKLSANGRESVRKLFSWDVVGGQFESLYLSLTD